MEERIQKILSRAGYGSRRSCEEFIESGRVLVNGKIATLGMKADLTKDKIVVDGVELPEVDPKKLYIALHKPRGVLSDFDPLDQRPSVLDLVPMKGHLFSVGRLDLDSEGLILLTNDGELANLLTHPRYGHEKEYRVLVARRPDQEQLSTWRRGIVLEDGQKTRPAEVIVERTSGKGAWLRIVMREGKKRQIREVGKRIGLPVVRILRVRIGSLQLGNLKPKDWRLLTPAEVQALYALVSQKKEISKNRAVRISKPDPKRGESPYQQPRNERKRRRSAN
ncbi:MAG: rRNA pseudouridine synthase [Anaerolineae bacterium]|nr:rRNA pseudouridine synthase [Anaerolineae bacterium]